jgi:hypothetical protein
MKESKEFVVECECGCRVMMVRVYFDEEEKIWEYYFRVTIYNSGQECS